MLIAVAADGGAPASLVPEYFEDSPRLLIVETDTNGLVASYERQDGKGLLFAQKTLLHDCEAVVCGKFRAAEGFEALAAGCVTRYYGAGLGALEAAHAAEDDLLPLIRDFEGGTGCGSHGEDEPAAT